MSLVTRRGIEEPPHYLEKEIRFSFSKCDTGNFCIKKLARDELGRLYNKLGYFEKLTWGQLRKMPRENGMSLDLKDSKVFKSLAPKLPGASTFGHFRVTGSDVPIRVFIGLERDLAYMLLIDRRGELQH